MKKTVLNVPHFAPLYTYKGGKYLSFIEILRQKGHLKLNPNAQNIVDRDDFLFCPPNILIDREIKRVPFNYEFRKNIVKSDVFVYHMASAIVEDAKSIEAEYPDFTIVILVGGKDSLNLLLVPWKNPVLVVSSEPNYSLVKDFIKNNKLTYKLVRLFDERNVDLKKEILLNACRCNLEQFRWTGHLKEIVDNLNQKAIILKGQWGDVFQTEKWKTYTMSKPTFNTLQSKLPRIILKDRFFNRLSNTFLRGGLQKAFFRNLWHRGAHWQGVHMSFLYDYIGVPVLSGYHGPKVIELVTSTDYFLCINMDLRSMIGEEIFGKRVVYPEINPSPPSSIIRKGISGTKPFLEEIKRNNIQIIY